MIRAKLRFVLWQIRLIVLSSDSSRSAVAPIQRAAFVFRRLIRSAVSTASLFKFIYTFADLFERPINGFFDEISFIVRVFFKNR